MLRKSIERLKYSDKLINLLDFHEYDFIYINYYTRNYKVNGKNN